MKCPVKNPDQVQQCIQIKVHRFIPKTKIKHVVRMEIVVHESPCEPGVCQFNFMMKRDEYIHRGDKSTKQYVHFMCQVYRHTAAICISLESKYSPYFRNLWISLKGSSFQKIRRTLKFLY